MAASPLVTELQVESLVFPPAEKAPGPHKSFFLGGAGMTASPPVMEVKVEDYVFPPTAKAPGSDKSFFLGGAGARGLEIEGKFIKFTAIGVYLEESAIPVLAAKWKGKTAEELAHSVEFFRDIVSGPFEKFTQVTMILPLTGEQYAEKVSENCVDFWKRSGVYSDNEAKAVQKFVEAFKDEKFPPGHSILFTLSPLPSLTVESFVFPPAVKAPGSHKSFFLGGAGARGLEIDGKFIIFTIHGFYLEHSAISALAVKWKAKTASELAESLEFFRDIITGPFEKLTQITMILPLTGPQFSEKVMENSVEVMKNLGTYSDEESKAVDKFFEAFQHENFPPGRACFFTQSPLGSLTIAFSQHESIPEAGNTVIENKNLSEAILDTIIGEHGVNPEGKRSLAARLSELMSKEN